MLAIDSSGGHSPWTIVTDETVELLASSSIVGAYGLRYSASRRAPGFAALE
jgi:hypothetical protein